LNPTANITEPCSRKRDEKDVKNVEDTGLLIYAKSIQTLSFNAIFATGKATLRKRPHSQGTKYQAGWGIYER
jgi:hypothetical protein